MWDTLPGQVGGTLEPCEVRMCGDGGDSEVIFLNRVLSIVHSVHSEKRPSFEIESDLRRAEIILSELGLPSEKTKTVETLVIRE